MAENYTVPNLCSGTWTLAGTECADNEKKYQEQLIASALEISGAPINVFKLLGVHEQGKLIDLTGNGFAMSGGTDPSSNILNAFNTSSDAWISSQVGMAVLSSPSWIGYNFGIKKTSYGADAYAPPQPIRQNVSTIRIQQSSNPLRRVLQCRIEKSNGKISPRQTSFTGVGDGTISTQTSIRSRALDSFSLIAISSTSFTVQSSFFGNLGIAEVGQQFLSNYIKLTIMSGSIPFAIGDVFNISFDLAWDRVAIINLPNTDNLETISFTGSTISTYWRLVPIMFNGVVANEPWEILQLQLLDYEATDLRNIQDLLLMENRDRDYASEPISIKCQYSPFDSIGDLGKFGINILDQYVFTCSFATMVEKLGRPIVTGDVLEVTPETAYNDRLEPVKKYLEVTDTGWAAEGFSTSWVPLVFRFQAEQLIPSQEHRDIFGTRDSLEDVADADFLAGLNQVESTTKRASDDIGLQAKDAVPEIGENILEIQQIDIAADNRPDLHDKEAKRIYIEDGLPPNGEPYGEGFKLPDMVGLTDGIYYRLNYPDHLNIPARLYRFSLAKNKWIYIETDRRFEKTSHKPSVQKILNSTTKMDLTD